MLKRFLVFTALVLSFKTFNIKIEAQQPALVDRELFFSTPEISGAQISPDGKYLAFMKPIKGVRNIWVKAAHEPFDKAKPLTGEAKRPISEYFWSWDNKILFVKDQAGDENFNLYAVNPAEAVEGIPAAKNLVVGQDERGWPAIGAKKGKSRPTTSKQ